MFSAQRLVIKKALTTVVIAFFYQHFDDYFCDGHLFIILLYSRLLAIAELLLFWGKWLSFLFVNPKRAGC